MLLMLMDDDVCRRDDSGKLLEIPIYCERRWLGAFVTPNRIYRAAISRSHKIANSYQSPGNATSIAPRRSVGQRAFGKLAMLTKRHPWKADFNQCSGRQLIRALERAEAAHGSGDVDLPFVLIGHSKIFTSFNERSLEPFLSFVQNEPERFRFATLASCDPGVDFAGPTKLTASVL